MLISHFCICSGLYPWIWHSLSWWEQFSMCKKQQLKGKKPVFIFLLKGSVRDCWLENVLSWTSGFLDTCRWQLLLLHRHWKSWVKSFPGQYHPKFNR
jgi:hypothetical protein